MCILSWIRCSHLSVLCCACCAVRAVLCVLCCAMYLQKAAPAEGAGDGDVDMDDE